MKFNLRTTFVGLTAFLFSFVLQAQDFQVKDIKEDTPSTISFLSTSDENGSAAFFTTVFNLLFSLTYNRILIPERIANKPKKISIWTMYKKTLTFNQNKYYEKH